MTKPRKPRLDSVAHIQRILAEADTELAPPVTVPLSDNDWPFWHSLTEERARADWTQHELEIAALLARTMAQLEAEQRAQRREGVVYLNSRGDPAPNPRNRVVSALTAQALAYRRSLALTGRAKAGSSEAATRQREANRAIDQRFRDGSPRDDLLA